MKRTQGFVGRKLERHVRDVLNNGRQEASKEATGPCCSDNAACSMQSILVYTSLNRSASSHRHGQFVSISSAGPTFSPRKVLKKPSQKRVWQQGHQHQMCKNMVLHCPHPWPPPHIHCLSSGSNISQCSCEQPLLHALHTPVMQTFTILYRKSTS